MVLIGLKLLRDDATWVFFYFLDDVERKILSPDTACFFFFVDQCHMTLPDAKFGHPTLPSVCVFCFYMDDAGANFCHLTLPFDAFGAG